MTELGPSRENFIKKRKEALSKINSFQEEFEKKKEKIRTDIEEVRNIWKEMSRKFSWWGSLP